MKIGSVHDTSAIGICVVQQLEYLTGNTFVRQRNSPWRLFGWITAHMDGSEIDVGQFSKFSKGQDLDKMR